MICHSIKIENKVFTSKAEACRYYNISQSTFNNRLLVGRSLEEALGIAPLEKREREKSYWHTDDITNENSQIIATGTYLLYEITNLINSKVYIGLTIQPLQKRWNGHVCDSKRSTGHLYHAMRKYGIENFAIKVIRNDAKSGYELQQQEIAEIERRDSRNPDKGYNIAPGGSMAKGKTIEIAGVKFHSYSEAANYYGIPAGAFGLRLSRLKWTPEQAAEIEPPPNPIPYKINHENEVLSLKALCKKLGKVNYKTAHLRVKTGWTINQAVGIDPPPESYVPPTQIEVNGKIYASLEEAAQVFGIKKATLHNRLKYQQVTLEQALGLEPIKRGNKNQEGKSITVFGQTYKSITACAKAHNVPFKNLARRISNGEMPEFAIQDIKIRKNKILSKQNKTS